MTKYDAAIIGAGPAGIMAAIIASERGNSVALIEKNPQIGKKLLATGNGRCNLTNTQVTVDRYHGSTPDFIGAVIEQFDQNATIRFFQDLGLVLKEEENGRIFPRTNQALSVVEVLRQKLTANGVDVLLDSQVESIDKSDEWDVNLASGQKIQATNLIIATGGRAAHQFGSTGDGWSWARKLGHSLTYFHAALVPLETVETWPGEIQGLRVDARVWATCEDSRISEETGDTLFTSYGVSGPCIMAQAGAIAPNLKTSQVLLHIDLFPDITDEDLHQTISRILHNSIFTIKEALAGVLPKSLIPIVLRLTQTDENSVAGKTSEQDIRAMVRTLKDTVLTVSKLRPLKEAQATAGGLDTNEINPLTLQSNLIDNLYFAGEIIDVDGDSGGFNLQWAWSSGYVAGKSTKS